MANKSLLVGWRERWNRSLLQFLRRRTRATVDIEDLAQETYLRLLRARDLDDVRNPQAYLLTVASHVLAEWRKNQEGIDATTSAQNDVLIDESLPEFELEAILSQDRVDRTLAAMPPTMRAIVLLRLRDERSNKDIAESLDLTLRQVRRYLEKGYERLHEALDD